MRLRGWEGVGVFGVGVGVGAVLSAFGVVRCMRLHVLEFVIYTFETGRCGRSCVVMGLGVVSSRCFAGGEWRQGCGWEAGRYQVFEFIFYSFETGRCGRSCVVMGLGVMLSRCFAGDKGRQGCG